LSISFGLALVAGKKRVPKPATGNTALLTGLEKDAVIENPIKQNEWADSSGDQACQLGFAEAIQLGKQFFMVLLKSSQAQLFLRNHLYRRARNKALVV
jgi:hypothetical protein